ncbi:NAD-dependent epimerase/dehydratase family protein [Amycolatopsis regifaucium]|uniref:NAD-dependent epimerase/dehydratase n=1 Tax=Amycolatopsis regifaucium TaxID=546365 RepID=A0A154M754_9PSEU|nr:NAD-dependent epimerase/dehydratase family protein [Amycolatopsis regifaucium]KZB80187.1 oxidoreductase [Amycolatopsis regifaucium]OKA09442.1 NAD-dependent epimerase/dehydratase [Amycolatopsis regifaucium]SFH61511.1 reductase VcaE [Amycolatopsis regifaucium]
MQTITVLGASGFVGSAVTRALARRPIRLRAVARRRFTPPPGRAEITVVAADLTDRAALADAVAGSDAVVYLLLADGGWRAAEGAERVNVGVLRDLVELVGGDGEPPLVVFAGSTTQVGVPPREPLDGSEPDHPATPYDVQKLAAEEVLKKATAEGVVRGISLRLPTIFGENTVEGGNHDRGVVSAMARRALEGQALTVWGDGTVRRDLLHVEDVAAAFTAALDHPDSLVGGHWLLGAGRGDQLGEVFRLVAREMAAQTGEDPVEVTCVEPPAHAPETDLRSITIDSTSFRAITGWRPEISLSDGVRRTVAALTSSVQGRVRT